MNIEQLAELYKSRAPNSSLSDREIQKDIAFLWELNLTGEQIFFAINYLSKFHPDDLSERPESVAWHWEEIKKYYEIAEAKKGRKALKESEQVYDKKNYYKGVNTPSWFRKSFDKHLFE